MKKELLWMLLFIILPFCANAQDVVLESDTIASTDTIALVDTTTTKALMVEALEIRKPKFGYLSYSEVIRMMPEYIRAQERLNLLQKRYDEELMREEKEVLQWEAQYDPDPSVRLPQHVFKRLNEKLLAEKEEVQKALAKAKGSMPKQVDYREEMLKFKNALDALEDPVVDVKIKNQFLKNIITRIEFEREPTVRITKENADKYATVTTKGMQYYTPPYKLKMKLKYK